LESLDDYISDEESLPGLFSHHDDDDSSCSADIDDELFSSIVSSFSTLNEANTSRSNKLDYQLHVSNSTSTPLDSSFQESFNSNSKEEAVLNMDFSCIPSSLIESLLLMDNLLNDYYTISMTEVDGLKVQDSSAKVMKDVPILKIQSKLELPSQGEEKLILDLEELPLDGKFCLESLKETKSVMYMEVVKRHCNLLSKCVHPDLKDYILPPQEVLPEEYAVPSPPSSFMSLIQSIITSPSIRPEPSPFKFDTSEESLAFNKKVLENFDFDMECLIPAFKNNIISPGSEFRDPMLLSPLLNRHKYWRLFKDIVENGVSVPFESISEEQRKDDLNKAIERGNHKSASTRPDLLEELV